MRLLLSSFATAALALVASAAPVAVAPEVTTDLPARFALYLVTAEERANGLRIKYAQSGFTRTEYSTNVIELTPASGVLLTGLNDSPQWPAADGVCESLAPRPHIR